LIVLILKHKERLLIQLNQLNLLFFMTTITNVSIRLRMDVELLTLTNKK